ncbi:MAG: hypothetical protein WA134_10180 [Rhodoferax sp.]
MVDVVDRDIDDFEVGTRRCAARHVKGLASGGCQKQAADHLGTR